MDAKMTAKAPAMSSDVVMVTSERRPTPTKTSFSEVMGTSAGSLVGGAESAMTALPGTSTVALAVRGGATGAMTPSMSLPGGMPLGGVGGSVGMGGLGTAIAEGPVVAPGGGFGGSFLASATAASSGDGGAAASLQQSEQSNLYYLQLQQQVNQQSQTFETLSNVMKSESDTVKNAIGNMH